jgi:hypothetical protein
VTRLEKRKAAGGRHAAFLNTSNDTSKTTAPRGFKQSAKRLIVMLALWGLLPLTAANWLIRRLHLAAE